jgi:carboxylate-amine ligase
LQKDARQVPEQVRLNLFDGFGIEIEYMIVATDDLAVLPVADEVLKQISGEYATEVELGDIAWSNKLPLHVIELKTNGPAGALGGLEAKFQNNVAHINRLLQPMGGCLLPSSMHPWMNPDQDLKLWPHGSDIIYQTFDRIFGCKGHGWANLQSVHLNLPFANDREFAQLHAAIRMVLPIISGLAASSPFVEGQASGLMDSRLDLYRGNSARVPSVAGIVIPERAFSRKEYETGILKPIYRDLEVLDPAGVLRHEWVNSRGCIARFDRYTIEIRLVDVQECPQADIAVAAAIAAAVRCLVEEHWCSKRSQQLWDERELAAILADGIREADEAVIENRRLLDSFGFPDRGRVRVRELWQHLVEATLAKENGTENWQASLALIANKGCLARRISQAAGAEPSRDDLHSVYLRLARCLETGTHFEP